MLIRGYRYTYKLNTAHDISDEGNQEHMHTFVIEVLISAESDDKFVTYFDMVKSIDSYLDSYKGKLVNNFKPFYTRKPTLENMAYVFYRDIAERINDKNFKVFKLTISETPLNKYTISDRMVVGDARFLV